MERPEDRRHAWIICLLLAAVTFALYLPVSSYDYIYFDDPTYVKGNPYVLRGITSNDLMWALTTGHGSNWHPLTWMSHMLDVQLYGVSHPGAHHITSVLFHVANTLLLFLVLRRMTGAVWRSAVVAALFAWHPLHVESVAWISERKDVLSTFFGLLTMHAYTSYVREPAVPDSKRRRYYILTIVLFALGLMSKPMLVTLPFVLLLLDYWPLCRSVEFGIRSAELEAEAAVRVSWVKLVWEKAPMFGLSLLSSVVTFLVQRQAMMHIELLPPSLRIANAAVAYIGYLKKMVWPTGLTIFYPLSPISPTDPSVLVSAGLLVAFTIAALILARRRRYVLLGWLWFLGMLVPVIGLVQVGSQSMADRYSYMSLVGIFIIFVWGIADILGHGHLNRPGAAWAVIMPLLVICLMITRHQIPYWKNTETLFRHDLAIVRDNSIAHISLATFYAGAGRTQEARAEYLAGLRLQPQDADILNGLGLLYARQNDVTNALACYNSAIAYKPDYSDAHYNEANLLADRGKLAEAAEHYTEALRLKPDSADAHNNLGAVLVRLGRLPEALAQFKEALRLLPDYPEAQDQMGGVLLKMGHPEVAQLHYEEAVRLKPDFAHAQLKLGLVLAEQNYLAEAIPHFETAIKLEPTNADAYFNLAAAYAALNRDNDAAKTFAEVLRISPDDVDARTRLAAILQTQGKTEEAIQNYREVLRLRMDSPQALRGLAWILATSAKPELRNGTEAVKLAEHANDLTSHKQTAMLSALDASYAEAGRFDDAIKTAEQVRQIATAQNQKSVADQAAKRVELYRAGKSFHE